MSLHSFCLWLLGILSWCPVIWRGVGKWHWHFQIIVCDHWYLQFIVFSVFLETHLSDPLTLKTLFSSPGHYINRSLMSTDCHLTAPSQLAPLRLGTDSCFPSLNPEACMGTLTCPFSKDSFSGQASVCRVLALPFWLFSRSPAMF